MCAELFIAREHSTRSQYTYRLSFIVCSFFFSTLSIYDRAFFYCYYRRSCENYGVYIKMYTKYG